jgi:hypothetical protein
MPAEDFPIIAGNNPEKPKRTHRQTYKVKQKSSCDTHIFHCPLGDKLLWQMMLMKC